MRSQEEEPDLQSMERRCREIFDRFDRDKDGSITELEMAALLRSLGVKPDCSQIESLFNRADRNSNGLVEFGEFLQLIKDVSRNNGEEHEEEVDEEGQALYKQEELVTLFKAFDKDGNGFITAAELAHSMAKMGRRLSWRELADMMAEADADGDGRISFDEFVSALSGRV